MTFNGIEMVFFDAGETLLHPRPNWSEASATILRDRGHTVPTESLAQIAKTIGRKLMAAADQGIMFSVGPDESRKFWGELYGDLLETLKIDDAEAPSILFDYFSDARNYDLFADVIPTLTSLKSAGMRMGVISNFETWLRGMLADLEVVEFFEVIAISGELGTEKPHSKIFEWSVAEARLEPNQCLHIGDSPRFDYDAATDCGLQAVLIDRHDRFDRPIRRRVLSLQEIPSLVG